MGKRETVLLLISNQLTASVVDFVSEWMYQGSVLKQVTEISNHGRSKVSNKWSLKTEYNSNITASYNWSKQTCISISIILCSVTSVSSGVLFLFACFHCWLAAMTSNAYLSWQHHVLLDHQHPGFGSLAVMLECCRWSADGSLSRQPLLCYAASQSCLLQTGCSSQLHWSWSHPSQILYVPQHPSEQINKHLPVHVMYDFIY